MSEKWTPTRNPRPLPARRVPLVCAGNPLGHFWLIGSALVNTARKSVRHPHLMGFFDRHVRRAGLVWYACYECGWCDCVTEDRLPIPGRYGTCLECMVELPYRNNRNGMQVRCVECARRHRQAKMREYRRGWKERNPDLVRAQHARNRARRRLDRIAREIMEEQARAEAEAEQLSMEWGA